MTANSEINRYHVRAGEDHSGTRLDSFLAQAVSGLSRSRLKKLITDGHVTCGENPVKDPAFKVKSSQEFHIIVPEPEEATPRPQDIPLHVVYEDDQLIVINKPPGLVVHPAPGNPDRTLVNALLAHCGDSLSGIGGVKRPGIVHRLDKDTSGLMVAAKTDIAHAALAKQFANHSMERAYLAVVRGVPNPSQGEISSNIGRNPKNRKKMAVLPRGGKSAITRYRLIRTLGKSDPPVASLVECRLATGRTHQIRVHMTNLGHPLVGDQLYGRAWRPAGVSGDAAAAIAAFKRQALHATMIGFKHPTSTKNLKFEQKIPLDMNELIFYLDNI
ncbi:MAG: RluA family pseudouridine synthase [Alphaproteobacteria bacterium]|nr:RluA family pseudouridine synthase [Alphaproteobacteria bacterium]